MFFKEISLSVISFTLVKTKIADGNALTRIDFMLICKKDVIFIFN